MELLYPKRNINNHKNAQFLIRNPNKNLNFKILFFESIDGTFVKHEAKVDVNTTEDNEFFIITILSDLKFKQYKILITDDNQGTELISILFNVSNLVNLKDIRNELAKIAVLYKKLSIKKFVSNGIGKSGTSWLMNILSHLPGLNYFDQSKYSNHYQGVNEMPIGKVFHGHFSLNQTTRDLLVNKKIIFVNIVRDLRSIIVSEYFHKFCFMKGKFHPELINYPKNKLLTMDYIPLWSTTINMAYDAILWSEFYGKTFCKYEDMLNKPLLTFGKILQNLELDVPNIIIHNILELNKFEVFTGPRANNIEDNNSFFRSGKISNWKMHLDNSTSELIKKKFKYFFLHFNYD